MLLSVLLLGLSIPFATAKETIQQKLVALARENDGVIKLDSDTYNLITSTSREWSATIQLTALKSFKCAPCKEFDKPFRALGRAWITVPQADRDQHFFASLDYDDGPDVFRKLGINTAPLVHIHPPAKGPRRLASGKTDPLTLDLSSDGFDATWLTEQLSRHTPVPIPYKAPPDYTLIITTMVSLLTAVTVARFILPILMSRWTWAFVTIATSLVMVGGFMFVHIRGMPYVVQGQDGAQLIARGYQMQYGIEVQIIAALYAFLSFNLIALTLIVPRQASASKQRYAVFAWTGISFTLFSILVSLFRIKNGGYPFKLMF